MENSKDKLHYHIGRLFYAIAMADKKIHKKEIETLNTNVLESWRQESMNMEGFNSKSTKEILVAFAEMQKNAAESETCYNVFRDFYLENKSLFTIALRKLIWDTAQAIAMSSAQKNKSELVILAKLRMLFQS